MKTKPVGLVLSLMVLASAASAMYVRVEIQDVPLERLVSNLEAALAKAPKGKGSAADLEAMNADVAGVEASIGEMDAAMAAGNYKDAKVKAEAAKATLDRIVADVAAAIAAKKGR